MMMVMMPWPGRISMAKPARIKMRPRIFFMMMRTHFRMAGMLDGLFLPREK